MAIPHPPRSESTPRSAATTTGPALLLFAALMVLGTAAIADELRNRAIFAGGCFWCVEEVFDKIDGVVQTTSGYTGGQLTNPDYQQVSAGGTGHAEAVEVVFDPAKVTYQELLSAFWRNIDPVDGGGQFCDRGDQYRSAIFYVGAAQKQLAEQSKAVLAKSQLSRQPIATTIVAATAFYPAEEYHQNYHGKNPARYKFYKWNCGRQQRLDALWRGIDRLPLETQ